LLGPDLDGHYGSLQGVGGLEATVQSVGSQTVTTPVLNDYCGNVLAVISGTSVAWNPVRVSGYGAVPGYQAPTLLGGTPLANTLVWRSRGIDPSGFYNLGARYYDPLAGHFLSPDPLGHGASMDLYSFCGGDPVNRFDPTGRFGKGNFDQGSQALGTSFKDAREYGREFDLAHEDEIDDTLFAVDSAAVAFAVPVVAEALLEEGMGVGAGLGLEEGELGGVEAFNSRSALWAASPEVSEGVGLAEAGTAEAGAAGSAATTIAADASLATARSIASKAALAEPGITPVIQQLAEQNGGQVVGLQNVVKSESSLAIKLAGTSQGQINDALRYTITFDNEALAEGASKSIADLEASGFEKLKVQNTFMNNATYKGINTVFRSPSGQSFELQFHTPESYSLKQSMHSLYETARVLPANSPEGLQIENQMREASQKIPQPPNLQELVPNYRRQ
jgi:RHS repeat-associated protein